MDAAASAFKGVVGFYVKDLATGAAHEYGADRPIPTASICKVTVMLELFQQAQEGKLSLGDRYPLFKDISKFSGGTMGQMTGQPVLSLRDYCRIMIAQSDNMATDQLAKVVGLDNVNANLRSLGLRNTAMPMLMGEMHYRYAGLSGEPSDEKDRTLTEFITKTPPGPEHVNYTEDLTNNVTSARDMGTIMERIYYGQMVSPKASWEMLEMLKMCDQRTKIPGRLKADVVVAHKIGGSNRIQGDVGIALLPSGPMVICMLTRHNDYRGGNGVQTIAELSRMAVEAFSPESVN